MRGLSKEESGSGCARRQVHICRGLCSSDCTCTMLTKHATRHHTALAGVMRCRQAWHCLVATHCSLEGVAWPLRVHALHLPQYKHTQALLTQLCICTVSARATHRWTGTWACYWNGSAAQTTLPSAKAAGFPLIKDSQVLDVGLCWCDGGCSPDKTADPGDARPDSKV